jgi:hypothetical protein
MRSVGRVHIYSFDAMVTRLRMGLIYVGDVRRQHVSPETLNEGCSSLIGHIRRLGGGGGGKNEKVVML